MSAQKEAPTTETIAVEATLDNYIRYGVAPERARADPVGWRVAQLVTLAPNRQAVWVKVTNEMSGDPEAGKDLGKAWRALLTHGGAGPPVSTAEQCRLCFDNFIGNTDRLVQRVATEHAMA